MKTPWHGKSALAKVAAICAVIFLVSLGLCGVDFAITRATNHYGSFAMISGVLEIIGMLLSGVALSAIAIMATFRAIFNHDSSPTDTQGKP